MYDIEELEAQWRRYNRRRMLRHGLVALGILLVLALPILYVTFKPAVQAPSEGNTSKTVRQSAEAARKRAEAPAKEPKAEATAPLKTEVPSMQQQEAPVRKKPKMLISFSNDTPQGATGEGTGGKVEMNLVKRADASVVKEIEKRFPLSREYDDAMYLAKYYYGKKLYKKSEYWAMQANTIDSTQPESWIVFGKSKAKRGHRKEALRVLQQYYDNTGNTQVKMLIDKIRRGQKF